MKIDPKRLRLYAVTDRAWTHDTEGRSASARKSACPRCFSRIVQLRVTALVSRRSSDLVVRPVRAGPGSCWGRTS